MSQALEVQRVVKHGVNESPLVMNSDALGRTPEFMRLSEVLSCLHAYLSQNHWLHAGVTCFLIEKVLGLSQHETAKHAQTLLGKVTRSLGRGQIHDECLQVVEDESGLLELLAGFLNAITG